MGLNTVTSRKEENCSCYLKQQNRKLDEPNLLNIPVVSNLHDNMSRECLWPTYF